MATEIKDLALLDANGSYNVMIHQTGWHRVQIADKQNQAFGSGNVTVKQEGVVYDQFSAITAPTARLLYLSEGSLDIVVAGATTPSLRVRVEPARGSLR